MSVFKSIPKKGRKKEKASTRPFGGIAECNTSFSENLLQQDKALMFPQRLGMVLFPLLSTIACFPSITGTCGVLFFVLVFFSSPAL